MDDNPPNEAPAAVPEPPELAATNDLICSEAAQLFPVGKHYSNALALKLAVRDFAHSKGFVVSTDGC